MKRIIVETSDNRKGALESLLRDQGITLSEWFNDKVEEIVDEPIGYYNRRENDLTQLSFLEKPASVFKVLSDIDWSFSADDTSYLSHSIHPYPAKYIPQIPNQLIRLLSLPGEKVWDPFGGSGTTALESLLLGRQAYSTDINPISQIIGKAKCLTLTLDEDGFISSFGDQMNILASSQVSFDELFVLNKKEIKDISPSVPNKEKWFHEQVWKELGLLKWKIINIKNEKVRILLLSILSKIVIKVSNQDSETRYVSKPKQITYGYVLKLFSAEVKSTLPKIKKLGKLLKFREANFSTADLRFESKLENNSIDLIVTSPPYPNATDYHLYHRFRIFWLGFDPVELGKCEIGSHLRHQKEKIGIEKYIDEMRLSLMKMHSALRPGRYAVLILGDAVFDGQDYETAELVGGQAENVGFEFVGIYKRSLHTTKRSFVSTARRLREEKFLVIRKKDQIQKFRLNKPPYKLWPYEEEIRKLEIKNVLGVESLVIDKDYIMVEVNSLKTDLLKRLTFTHSFKADNYSIEPSWQSVIENGDALTNVSKRKDPKYATHGIHAYKGKFYPQLAKSLFNLANLKSGDNVLDPFCGSGTVLLEGYLNGLNSTGFDLNPIALKIASAKLDILKVDSYLLDKLLSSFIDKIEKAKPIKGYNRYFNADSMAELVSWFPELVLRKVATIVSEIGEVPNIQVKGFLEVCLSSIVRDISQQDPKDLRIRRRKEPIKDAQVFKLFLEKVIEQRDRLRHFAERSNKASSFIGITKVVDGDSRLLSSRYSRIIHKESIDCVVTSPPYATALPYVDTDRLSILLLFSMLSKERKSIEDNLVGARDIVKANRHEIEERIENRDFDKILSNTAINIIQTVYKKNKGADVGFRKKNTASLLYRYYSDMTRVMENLNWAVRKDGNLFFVIGDNKTFAGDNDEEIHIRSSESLTDIGHILGWTHIKTIPITVTQENRHHNKNSILKNDILWFRK